MEQVPRFEVPNRIIIIIIAVQERNSRRECGQRVTSGIPVGHGSGEGGVGVTDMSSYMMGYCVTALRSPLNG